jgi:NAD(P)-dependent dehydrogenase (short-subunit alcohol dehydrogenase family)
MLFHLQSFGEESAPLNRASAIGLLHLLKYISGKPEKQRIITATSMGGKFGIHQPVNGSMSGASSTSTSLTQAAVVGIIKSAAKELTTSVCKSIDFAFDGEKTKEGVNTIASQLFSEVILDDSTLETGYVSEERFGLSVIDCPINDDLPQATLNKDSVILITGGARGITAEIAVQLAKQYKPTLILIGRSSLPEKEDSHYASLTGVRELKAKIIELTREEGKPVSIPHVEAEYKKIVKDREIRNNIERLEATANKVFYYNLDVRDTQALSELVEQIYKEHGKIDAVIHSAGVIEDALIKDKSTESFCRVFDTKVISALTLLNTLRLDSLRYLFLFSSVVGRTGNAGQSDYVAANEVLNKLALAAQNRMSGRAVSMMWGPWRGGMAQPELEEIFAQHGWSMISIPDGCAVFLDELRCSQKNESELLYVAELNNVGKPNPTGARLQKADLLVNAANNQEYIIELDTQVDTFLLDHAFDGVPVLPMAYALELMCEAAVSSYPDLPLTAIKTFDIPAGILFDSQRKKLSIIVQEKEKNKDHVIAQISIHSGTTKRRENFKAIFVMGTDVNQISLPEKIPSLISQSKPNDQSNNSTSPEFNTGSEIALPSVVDIYRQWLFHGPKFRGIQTINAAGDQGIWGRVTGLTPDHCLNLEYSRNWIIDPVMFDSSMQLGGIWARHCLDITVLPTGFRQLRFLRSPDYKRGDVVTAYILISPTDSKNELSCDLAIYNQAGQLCIVVEQLTGVGNKSLHRLVGEKATASIPK